MVFICIIIKKRLFYLESVYSYTLMFQTNLTKVLGNLTGQGNSSVK